jgi:hypothetical protein
VYPQNALLANVALQLTRPWEHHGSSGSAALRASANVRALGLEPRS